MLFYYSCRQWRQRRTLTNKQQCDPENLRGFSEDEVPAGRKPEGGEEAGNRPTVKKEKASKQPEEKLAAQEARHTGRNRT